VLYSADDSPLKPVTGVVDNNSTASGTPGQGDYHWGVLKVRGILDRPKARHLTYKLRLLS